MEQTKNYDGFNQAWVVADVKRWMRFAVRHKHTALLNKLSKDAQIDGQTCHLRQGVPYKERHAHFIFWQKEVLNGIPQRKLQF